MNDVLIYGATGYMGQLCAREFKQRGINPIVAGRSSSIQAVADEMGLRSRIIALDDSDGLNRGLDGVSLVLNAAGPFARTQQPLIEACLSTGTHYADLAGETEEMLSALAYDQAARDAGVMVLPGAGFGIVPTDLAALEASSRLPDADRLIISYATEGGASRGTLKTVLGSIEKAGVRRIDDKLVRALPAEKMRTFTVANRTFKAVYNPWRGDLVTAAVSTGIPTIETYTVFPEPIIRMMKGELLWLRDLALGVLLRFLPKGPSERQLTNGRTYIEAIAANGNTECSVTLVGPEAYVFTARCAGAISARIQAGDISPGFQTPSTFGRRLLDDMEGVSWGN